MKIEIAKHAGYCFGVERAIKLANEALIDSEKPIVTLGPIIHNPQVVNQLKEKGIRAISNINSVKKGTVIIRTHGLDQKIIEKIKKKGIEVIDATCPFVKKAQRCAANLVNEKYNVIIVGETNHPEVKGIMAYALGKAVVIESPDQVSKLGRGLKKIGVVVQTTQSVENLKGIVSKLVARASELKIYNTICDATTKCQQAAKATAKKTDIMLVVGGKNSANTSRLATICKATNPNTFHIETAKEIKPAWFKKGMTVGITAGASTADWILAEVIEKVKNL